MSALGFGTLANRRRPFYSTGGAPPVPPGPPGPPNKAPSIPVELEDPTTTTITIYFDAAGITGSAPLLYSVLYGISPNPTQAVAATLVSGTIYSATATGLTPDTEYFFKSAVRNTFGDKVSDASDGIFTLGGSGTPISAPPTVPTFVSNASDTITVAFDASGVSGSPPIEYKVYYGTTQNPVIPADAVLTTGSIYNATAINLLPSTQYYFKSVASNDVDTKISAISAPFSTTATPAGLTKLISGNAITLSPIGGNGVVTVNAFDVDSFSTAISPTSGQVIQGNPGGGGIATPFCSIVVDLGPTPISGFVIFTAQVTNNLNSALAVVYGIYKGSGASATILNSNVLATNNASQSSISIMYPFLNLSGSQTFYGYAAQLQGPSQPGQNVLNPSISVMAGGLMSIQTS